VLVVEPAALEPRFSFEQPELTEAQGLGLIPAASRSDLEAGDLRPLAVGSQERPVDWGDDA
jgi:hypothetical protein